MGSGGWVWQRKMGRGRDFINLLLKNHNTKKVDYIVVLGCLKKQGKPPSVVLYLASGVKSGTKLRMGRKWFTTSVYDFDRGSTTKPPQAAQPPPSRSTVTTGPEGEPSMTTEELEELAAQLAPTRQDQTEPERVYFAKRIDGEDCSHSRVRWRSFFAGAAFLKRTTRTRTRTRIGVLLTYSSVSPFWRGWFPFHLSRLPEGWISSTWALATGELENFFFFFVGPWLREGEYLVYVLSFTAYD